jgi:hypothetical protein
MNDTLQQILAIVVPIVVAALGAVSPVIISWLKKQKIVQQLKLEAMVTAMVPQFVEWVETWAAELTKQGEKPTSEAKLEKAMSFVARFFPHMKDNDEVKGRIEAALKKTQDPEKLING